MRDPKALTRFSSRVLLPMLRIAWRNRSAAVNYRIRPYSGRIVLLHTGDPEFTRIEDDRLGWDAVAQDGVEVHRISGSHLTLHEDPHVATLARELDEALATCRGSVADTKAIRTMANDAL